MVVNPSTCSVMIIHNDFDTCININTDKSYLTVGTCGDKSYLTFSNCDTSPFVMKIKFIVLESNALFKNISDISNYVQIVGEVMMDTTNNFVWGLLLILIK